VKNSKRNLHQEKESLEIRIFVVFPDCSTQVVKVFSSHSINILFENLPSGEKVVFYQGNIISSSNSFQNYVTSDYDRIVIINEEQMTFQTQLF
jgi:hypothetical protein